MPNPGYFEEILAPFGNVWLFPRFSSCIFFLVQAGLRNSLDPDPYSDYRLVPDTYLTNTATKHCNKRLVFFTDVSKLQLSGLIANCSGEIVDSVLGKVLYSIGLGDNGRFCYSSHTHL